MTTETEESTATILRWRRGDTKAYGLWHLRDDELDKRARCGTLIPRSRPIEVAPQGVEVECEECLRKRAV